MWGKHLSAVQFLHLLDTFIQEMAQMIFLWEHETNSNIVAGNRTGKYTDNLLL